MVLTRQAKEILDLILKTNKERGLADENFIFLTKEGSRMHDHAFNNVLRRLNGVRNEKDAFVIENRPSGNHSIRKTCISELKASGLITDEIIKEFAGHEDISTTQKSYIFPTTQIMDHTDAFEKVFSIG